MYELLTPSQVALADRITIENGIPGIELMENAGLAIVKSVNEEFPEAQDILVVCGIGNNGGDGYVAARHLADQGLNVQVLICGDREKVSGDARLALAKLDTALLIDGLPDFEACDLIIDALFGAGLDREIEGQFADTISLINKARVPVLAVDLPSGIDGRTGQVMGCAIRATHTVTFFRCRPGHYLLPGRSHCGETSLRQIGIDENVIATAGMDALLNRPRYWKEQFPFPGVDGHKYDRGHTLVLSGPSTATGAARLASYAALRSGSGLVTIASTSEALAINAMHLTSVMLQKADSPDEVRQILQDPRFNCVLLGPGMPPDKHTIDMVLAVLEMQRTTVLDAGALTAFSDDQDLLFEKISTVESSVFLTPHEGEFARLFPGERALPSKIDRARSAAAKSGATIILKGPDTVVATPGGQVCVSDNAPPWLATAGSGDVLAGVIAGLAGQGMSAFEAASAAVWLHSDAANGIGPGMISSDLDEGLRQSIRDFVSSSLT